MVSDIVVLIIMIIENTEDWAVAPAPGAPLKGVQAYLSRWGLAQPKPARYTSDSGV